MELKFSKPPEVKLSYSMLQNEAEWKSWTKEVLETLVNALETSKTNKEVFIEKTATELFENIAQCGYEEGYDSAKMENEEFL